MHCLAGMRRLGLLIVVVAGCGTPELSGDDAGLNVDAGLIDGGGLADVDAGLRDSGVLDGGTADSGVVDGGMRDSGVVDGGTTDAGRSDGGCGSSPLDLNDVSFLFPLPVNDAGFSSLLSLDSAGDAGALLPVSARNGLPSILFQFPNFETALIEHARVVGARIDPCFPGAMGACRKQLRLVAQPFHTIAQPPTAVDTTMHLFYDLNDAEFAGLVAGVRSLKQRAGNKTACKPLGPHPVMLEEGLGGPYATQLKALILSVAGIRTLSKVAFMRLGFPGEIWTFSMFDRVNAAWVATPIPLITQTSQMFVIPDVPMSPRDINPAPSGVTLLPLLNLQERVSASDAQLQPIFDRAFRLENPKLESPATADCVSCHVADRSRRETEFARNKTYTSTLQYKNALFDLSVVTGRTDLTAQRAFGYFERQVSVNQRVINESADVAMALSP